jgi:hypothetical protein
MTTHTISYNTAKRLKEFLGEFAPEPMVNKSYDSRGIFDSAVKFPPNYPAYQLHDLMSKPFAEAMAYRRDKMVCVPGKTQGKKFIKEVAEVIAHDLLNKYYDGGLPAVESALMEMMEQEDRPDTGKVVWK